MEGSRQTLVVTASSGVVRVAAGLLDAVFDELVDPARWCQHAYVRDATGESIPGPLLAAIESPRAASRCLLSSLLHQGLARGYRIEVEPQPKREGSAAEVTRAPATWLLAAITLASLALEMLDAHGLLVGPDPARPASGPAPIRPGQLIVSALVVLNDDASYDDVIWAAALAPVMLRTELDRRETAPR